MVDKIYDIVEDAKRILENKHGKNHNELFINDLFHFAVIDEAHKMENDSSFRPVIANLSPFFLKGIPTIFITATPTTAFLKMCKTFKYTTICVNAADRQKYTINSYKSSSSKKIAEAIYSEYKNGKKCVARMGSKHTITLVNKHLKELDPLLNILILRSEDKLDDDILEFSKLTKQNGPAKHIIITAPNVVTAHNLYNDLIKRYPKKAEWMGLFAGAEMAEEKAWKYSKHNPYKSVRKTRNNNLSQICKEK